MLVDEEEEEHDVGAAAFVSLSSKVAPSGLLLLLSVATVSSLGAVLQTFSCCASLDVCNDVIDSVVIVGKTTAAEGGEAAEDDTLRGEGDDSESTRGASCSRRPHIGTICDTEDKPHKELPPAELLLLSRRCCAGCNTRRANESTAESNTATAGCF